MNETVAKPKRNTKKFRKFFFLLLNENNEKPVCLRLMQQNLRLPFRRTFRNKSSVHDSDRKEAASVSSMKEICQLAILFKQTMH